LGCVVNPGPAAIRLGPGLLLSALLAAAAAGCSGDRGKQTVVEFWALGREGEVVQGMIPEFERRHPHTRVRVQQIPWSAAHEKLLTAYVGEAMPDVFQVGNTWIPEFVALRAVQSLDERIRVSGAIDRGDYFPGILDTNVIEGATYGVPWYVDTRLLFYRTDLLGAAGYAGPPRTWATWRDAMTRIEERAPAGRYAILLPMNEWQAPVILALQRGADLLRDDDGRGHFRDPRFRAAFEFYLSLFRDGLAPRAGAQQAANVYRDFAQGYFAFYITGPWNIGEFDHRLPRPVRDAWSTAPMPTTDDRYPGVSLAGGASLALFRGSAHHEAAWKLVEFLSEPARQVAFYRLTGDLPPRESAWRRGGLTDDPRAQAFWTQLHRVRSTPKIPEWERIADEIGRYSEAAIRGDLTAEQALAALDRDVDAVLEKRRWLLRRSGGAAAGRAVP
jgi:multiple sugar transport system substrate-binding protein